MRPTLILLLFLATNSIAYAKNSLLIDCRVRGAEGTAIFQLDAVGKGFLEVKKPDGSMFSCSLKLEDFEDLQGNVVPLISVEWTRVDCAPTLSVTENKEFLKEIFLDVNLHNPQKPEARIQWLRTKQPELCQLEKFNLPEIEYKAKQWRQRQWGRR